MRHSRPARLRSPRLVALSTALLLAAFSLPDFAAAQTLPPAPAVASPAQAEAPAAAAGIAWPESAPEAGSEPSGNPSLILFGSCAMRNSHLVWQSIVAAKPEVFVFLGDNIYADINVERGTPDNVRVKIMRERYGVLAGRPEFQAICSTATTFATWDDHDFGLNDAGRELRWKEESRDIFKAFWGEHAKQGNYGGDDGVYSLQQVGDVQFIMLDTRYNRSPIDEADGPGKTLLGEKQWAWLEDILANKPAKVRVIASSIQVLSDTHRFEKWGRNFESERTKLVEMIRRHNVSGVLFISGDRHCADMTVRNLGAGYNLYDVTSSGISASRRPGETTYLDPNVHRLTGFNSGDNFGAIVIDWSESDPILDLQIRDDAGELAARHKVRLSHLSAGAPALPVEGEEPEGDDRGGDGRRRQGGGR